ncbi:MAG: OmpA family protein [Bacteroidales bacterium]|jgi:chemotaxis protein MotB
MKRTHLILLGILTAALLFSCVPAKEYQALQEEQNKCLDANELLKEENKQLTVKNNEIGAEIKRLRQRTEAWRQDSLEKANKLRTVTQKFDRLNKQYNDLQDVQQNLVQGNVKETRALLAELQQTQENLQKQEDDLRQLQSKLATDRQRLTQLNQELEQRNKRLVELESILFRKDSIVNALKEKVGRALLGFTGKGLEVHQKDGKVYVSMDEKLLFRSGSTQVDPRGKQALVELASVLERNKDFNIMVEGHTDDVPYISSEAIKDNWDLSVKRATAIVRILLTNSNIEGNRIIAAGRSKYAPVDSADTPEARKKNRRTEIILTPNLDELFRIINETSI